MADRISLLEYLQWNPEELPLDEIAPWRGNTTSYRYGPGDISRIYPWEDFNLNTITDEFLPLLQETTIEREPMPSPPSSVRDEDQVRRRYYQFLDDRVRRALRAAFARLHMQGQMQNRAEISTDVGTSAAIYGHLRSDISFFEPSLPMVTRPNRAPGEIKPSWKWAFAMQDLNYTPGERKEFKKVLSQVNYYMSDQGARYGFVITDRELVAIRRLNNVTDLQLSNPVPWSPQENTEQPQLTILLALWYIGMLASDDTNWRLV